MSLPPWIAGWLRLLPSLVPALLFLPFVLAPPLNHDVAAVLSFSERWLAGERLYADLIDVNPPLIFVLNLLPAMLEEVAGVEGAVAVQLCVVALGLFAWSLSLQVRLRAAEGPVVRALLDVLPGFVLVGAGYDFGQREHLMLVAGLPYLLAAARRERGARPRGRVVAAVLAAVGFALKPHFLAIPALVELCVALGRLRETGLRGVLRDPVPWAMAAVWLLYLASLPLLFPEYLRFVVPLVWTYYLDEGQTSVGALLLLPRMFTALCLLLPLLWVGRRRGMGRIFGLAAVGSVLAAAAQHKGWSYHIMPIELLAGTTGAVLGAQWLDRSGVAVRPARVAGGMLGLVGLYAMAVGELPWKQLGYARSDVAGLAGVLGQEAGGGRVLVFSPWISPVFPALNYAHARLTLRTMNMWLLEGAYAQCLADGRRYREVWEMGRPEFYVYRSVAEDFARAPPAAVVVDGQSGMPWCGEEFDFIAYFSRHQLFAEVWSHYQEAAHWGRYRIFTRKD